jgi:hypothetical protein
VEHGRFPRARGATDGHAKPLAGLFVLLVYVAEALQGGLVCPKLITELPSIVCSGDVVENITLLVGFKRRSYGGNLPDKGTTHSRISLQINLQQGFAAVGRSLEMPHGLVDATFLQPTIMENGKQR